MSLLTFKIAAIIDYENLNNFHPISNLLFLANTLERNVAADLISHLSENSLFELLQSGFRNSTALVKVSNDFASDSACLSVLILLDLSDAVDHSLLITRLELSLGSLILH